MLIPEVLVSFLVIAFVYIVAIKLIVFDWVSKLRVRDLLII